MKLVNSSYSPYFWLSLLAAGNALLPSILAQVFAVGFLTALTTGFQQNAIIWLAITASCYLRWRAVSTRQLRPVVADNSLAERSYRKQHLICLLLALLLVIPSATLSWLICALAALAWRLNSRIKTSDYSAAVLMIALALREPVSQLSLSLFAEQILGFDSFLSSLLLSGKIPSAQMGNIIASNNFNLLILTGCSAFNNASLALLLWLTICLFLHQEATAADSWRVLILLVLVVLSNSLRLSLMTESIEDYQYFHRGTGATVFNDISTLLPLLCTNWRRHRCPHTR
ncbi:MAG: hypothetical protein MJK10_06745 [Pseudomonadales bacterium]|nr:hypothetical protein [Pseudomonadales bacterium]NRA14004.1 hypothetical protein [Oceanospirillaceae bacterium]